MSKYREHCTVADIEGARRSLRYLIESGRRGIIRTCKVWSTANGYSHKVTAYRVLVEATA